MDWNIIESELKYTFSRPAIADHQRSYLKETRVRLAFPVLASKGLSPEEKELIVRTFHHIVSTRGVLTITAGRDPSQLANKQYVTARLQDMLTELLKPRRKRVPPSLPANAADIRLTEKKRTSGRKATRNKPSV